MSIDVPPRVSPRRAKTRARLIEAAKQAIAERGFHATTLDDIAARAGLTKGAVYDNFSSKDALFLEVLAATFAQRYERFPWPTDRSGSVKDRLRRLGEAVLADEAAARLEAPLRAEYLLYTLTHEEMRRGVEAAAAERFRLTEQRVLQLFSPEELPMSPATLALILDSMTPGLIFIRAQAPGVVTREAILAAFEALA